MNKSCHINVVESNIFKTFPSEQKMESQVKYK